MTDRELARLRTRLRARQARWSLVAAPTDPRDWPQYGTGAIDTPGTLRRTRDGALRMSVRPNARLRERPRRLDWRDVDGRNYVSAARDQMFCSACVAFAVVAAMESHRAIAGNTSVDALDLSEASLFFVANRGCERGSPDYGWWIEAGLDAAIEIGVTEESVYPYVPLDQRARIRVGTPVSYRLTGYDSTDDPERMKAWLFEHGPLVAQFTMFDDFLAFWNAGEGVYTATSERSLGKHAVLVVGYDDDAHAWLCKNSWGDRDNHPGGCFRIAYREGGIDDRMYLPIGVRRILADDTIVYDPATLELVRRGDAWALVGDAGELQRFADEDSAREGLRIARRHTRLRRIGRDNHRPDRDAYIIQSWEGTSTLPGEPLAHADVVVYDPGEAEAVDADALGWRIEVAANELLRAHDLDDALAALEIVRSHTRRGRIGAGQPPALVMTYWE